MPSAFLYAPLAPVRTVRLCLAGRLHVDETAAFLAGGEHNHGLGLAIVAAIARMHGGTVLAESSQGITAIGLILPGSR